MVCQFQFVNCSDVIINDLLLFVVEIMDKNEPPGTNRT